MSKIWILENLCTGCANCEATCPFAAVRIKDGKAKIQEHCRGCGACIMTCPAQAITFK